jgi:ketosteroid isomerase-like protein
MTLLSTLLLLPFLLADLQTSWNSLVDAERAFAQTSVSTGTKEAFLGVLAEDSIIFRPHAVTGKKWTAENPAPTSQLIWEPEFADISAAGDLGYTTGPWQARKTPQDPPAAFGHYVTLWRKQQDGQWKVVFDLGIGHGGAPKPSMVESPQRAKDAAPAKPKSEQDAAMKIVAASDKAASSGLMNYLADDGRLYRDGALPFVGKSSAQKRLVQVAGALTSTQRDAHISQSADLAYTYGTAEFKPSDASKNSDYANYLRIWKKQRDGSWKIALDLLSVAPKP